MMRNGIVLAGAAALTLLGSGIAVAGITDGNVPAPGILGLVALGVIGAIAIARYRK